MLVKQAIREIAEDTREEQTQRYSAPPIRRFTPEQKESDDDERDAGKGDEEAIVIREGTKGGARIRHVHKLEKTGNEHVRLSRINEAEDEIFRQLVQRVKRQGE